MSEQRRLLLKVLWQFHDRALEERKIGTAAKIFNLIEEVLFKAIYVAAHEA